MSLKILQTSDWHMDSPFEALPSSKAATRRAELRELPGKVARLAVKEKVDMVLLPGDLLDSESFFCETGEELFRVLRNLPIPVFIAPGNHDYYSGKSPYSKARLPSNICVFTRPEIEFFDFSELGFRVFGAAFTDKSSPPILKKFKVEKTEGVMDIMCVHGDIVTGDAESSKYNPVTLKQIAESGMDYIALGHVHSCSGLKRSGNTFYSYSGCPEGRGFDETGGKTVNIVELSAPESPDGAANCSLRTVPVCSRTYECVEIDVTDRDPLLAIQMELPDETIRDVYRIVLRGETDSPVDVGALYANLSQYFFELDIRNGTTLRRDIWEKAGDGTLRGLFLSKMRVLYEEAADEGARLKVEQAVRWGLAALDNREEVVRHENF